MMMNMQENELKDEIERLKKQSKEYWNQKEEYKKKVTFLQEQVFKVLERHKYVSVLETEKTLSLNKIVNELISKAKEQLLIITPYVDMEYVGKLMDKATATPTLKTILVTKDVAQLKEKDIQKAFKLLVGFAKIQHITNVFTSGFMMIRDKEEMIIASGGLSAEHLNSLFNVGMKSEEKDDINLMLKFVKAHLPTFMEV